MITKEELKEYSRLFGLNLGQAEKDYFQIIFLFIIYREFGNELVFKGGTALKKCYGLNRFSEDLDFTALKSINYKKIEEGLKRFSIEYEFEKKEYPLGLKLTFRIKGPLYINTRMSLCKLILDFSFREQILLPSVIKTIGRFLEEIPSFDVLVMDEKEILAEKIRAIMTRDKARDVYDLWFLIDKGITFNKDFAQKKLDFYNEKFSINDFKKCLDLKKSLWEKELEPLIGNVPEFKEVRKKILSLVK
jgi:predicted nucleotidyltransferase component of viral defense system